MADEKEQLEARIKELEEKLAKKRQPKTKGIEFRVEFDLGLVQIRRLLPQAIELPVWVVQWLFSNQKAISDFIHENQHLLAMAGDSDADLDVKLQARKDNLLSDNPVVRKPRAATETQES